MAVQGYDRALVLASLGKLKVFEASDQKDLAPLVDAVSGRITLDDGEDLCTEGAVANNWWLVLEGTADVTANGKPVGSIGTQETVGELSLFDGGPVSATVTASGGLDVLVFDRTNFIQVIESSPPLAMALLSSASARLRATNALV